MLKALSRNRRLKHINLSGNKIIRLTARKQHEQELELQKPLTKDEQRVAKYLTRIIKKSESLTHLNLSDIGLKAEIICQLCACINESKTMQSVHFSKNPGLSLEPAFVQRIADVFRIKEYFLPPKPAKEDDGLDVVDGDALDHNSDESDNDKSDEQEDKDLEAGGLRVFVPEYAPKRPPARLSQELRRRHLEDGRALKDLVKRLRLSKGCAAEQETEYEGHKLVIHRILGFENVCPDVHKWVLECGQEAQCWICDRWKFSVALWNKKIGESGADGMQAGAVNPLMVEKQFQRRVHPPDIATSKGIPQFYGEQTFWRPVPMRRIEDFCDKIDEERPDFLRLMKK